MKMVTIHKQIVAVDALTNSKKQGVFGLISTGRTTVDWCFRRDGHGDCDHVDRMR